MKRIVAVIALLLATNAYADWVAAVENNSGGFIILTDNMDREPCNGEPTALSTVGKKVVGRGCWVMRDGKIHIAWDTGNVRSYNVDHFKVNGESREASSSNDYRGRM